MTITALTSRTRRLTTSVLTAAAAAATAATLIAAPTASALTGGETISGSGNPALSDQAATSLRIGAGTSRCSATLLDENWILTAEHCLTSVETTQAGKNHIVGQTDSGDMVTTHGLYAVTWPAYDVALVRTAGDLTDELGPGLSVGSQRPSQGETLYARGHGNTFGSMREPNSAPARQMPVTVNRATFHNIIGDNYGWQTSGKDYIRNGDSGSGVVNARGELVAVLGKADNNTRYNHPDNGVAAWRVGGGADLTDFPQLAQARSNYANATSASAAKSVSAQTNTRGSGVKIITFDEGTENWIGGGIAARISTHAEAGTDNSGGSFDLFPDRDNNDDRDNDDRDENKNTTDKNTPAPAPAPAPAPEVTTPGTVDAGLSSAASLAGLL